MTTTKKQKTIPSKDEDFNRTQAIIATKINSNAKKWSLDETWIKDHFNPARTKWETSWANYEDPNQRTHLLTFEKTKARKEYEPLLRLMVRNLEVNTLLTDEERAEMGIFPPKPRTPVKVPTTRPEISIKIENPAEIVIHFKDYDATSRAKPEGVHGMELKYDILTAPPEDPEALIHSTFDTRSPYTLKFRGSERGKTVYMSGRWENTKGEKGPWSEIINTIIP